MPFISHSLIGLPQPGSSTSECSVSLLSGSPMPGPRLPGMFFSEQVKGAQMPSHCRQAPWLLPTATAVGQGNIYNSHRKGVHF